MKYQVKSSSKIKFGILTIAILLLIIPACDPLKVCPDPGCIQKPVIVESFEIGPDGGTIRALNGNVFIDIPKGALVTSEKFTIEEGPEDHDNEFIMKSIIIKPKAVVFKKPASLSLKYNGKLSCGVDPCKATSLVLYHFENDATFDKRGP